MQLMTHCPFCGSKMVSAEFAQSVMIKCPNGGACRCLFQSEDNIAFVHRDHVVSLDYNRDETRIRHKRVCKALVLNTKEDAASLLSKLDTIMVLS